MKYNYFEVLQLPVKLVLDHNELKKNYFNLLKASKADPILDPKGTDDTKRIRVIEDAYQTLRDRILRIEHLLAIQGVRVANDNKPPVSFLKVAEQVEEVLEGFNPDNVSNLNRLKELHRDVLGVFSEVSIELAKLETAWDQSGDVDLLKKIRRKSAAFSYIRRIDQSIRDMLSA